jgi:hypothetical protein
MKNNKNSMTNKNENIMSLVPVRSSSNADLQKSDILFFFYSKIKKKDNDNRKKLVFTDELT